MTAEVLTTTAPRLEASVHAASFIDTLASEWIKLTTLRSTYVLMSVAVVLAIAMSAAVSAAVGSTFDSWSTNRQLEFTPILLSVSGNIVTLITLSVFGVLVAAGEYSSGMIRLTLAATPRRGRVLLAKLLLVTGISTVVGLVSVLGMFMAGQVVLGAYGIPVANLADPDAQRLVLGLGLATPLFPVMGFALGIILRSTAGAITSVLALQWMPVVFGSLLPTWPQENILSRLLGPAADSVTVAHLAESPMYSDATVGAVVVMMWLAGFIGTAYVALLRRDA